MFLVWKEEYSVGGPSLDYDHRKMVKLAYNRAVSWLPGAQTRLANTWHAELWGGGSLTPRQYNKKKTDSRC